MASMASGSNEFRKRGGRSSPSSGSSLPRPGFSAAGSNPRGSPTNTRRAYSGGNGMGAPAPFSTQPQEQRSSSYNAPQSGMTARPAYASSTAYNPSSSNGSSQYGAANGNYGGYGAASNNGYSNGLASVGSSHRSGLGSDDKYAKKKRRSGDSSGIAMVVGGIILFVYAVFMTTLYFSNSSKLKTMLKRVDQPDIKSVEHKFEEFRVKLKNAEAAKQTAERSARNKVTGEINQLERENRLIKEKHDELVDVHLPASKKEFTNLNNRDKAFMDQVGWLMDRTRRESKRMVLERFGPGPHKVEFTYIVEGKQDAENHRHKFVVELAPLELVPHAIHLFLEQVDHGLMEGTHFYLNGPHIMQAGPQPDWSAHDSNDYHDQKEADVSNHKIISGNAINTIDKFERNAAEKKVPVYDDDEYESYYTVEDYWEEDKRTKMFQELGLAELAFPDYHSDFPHLPWTIGFTGRPGGPDWYINKVDNSKGHGPGGQPQHNLKEQGDSCFGTISAEGDGRNMLATHVYGVDVYGDNSEWHHFITHPIEIVHASITTKDPILDRHLHLGHLHSQHQVFGARTESNRVKHGEGVNPDRLPQAVHDMVNGDDKDYTIKKVDPHQRRPLHMDGATEA